LCPPVPNITTESPTTTHVHRKFLTTLNTILPEILDPRIRNKQEAWERNAKKKFIIRIIYKIF
jgi:hypothetical protein